MKTRERNDALTQALEQHFGHKAFRPAQREIIENVLDGRPTLALMPTGGGKSLCYQLPAVLLDGLTLVVSPLVALMKDQVDALARRGIPAGFLNSSQSERERSEVERRVAGGRLKLLFVSPERLRSEGFTSLIGARRPVLVAVDEAHCVSEWGDTFRPDYALLGESLERLQSPRLLALTATASPDVRSDIINALRMKRAVVHASGFDRPNLHLEVVPLSSEAERLDTTTQAVLAHSPAIVYAATRKQTEALARHLERSGVRVRAYHAGLGRAERAHTQDEFLAGDVDVVCATNAFGLGIDKPDVRLVLHAQLPPSLDSYWQEAGRGGRDGQAAISGLLFLKQDIFVRRRLLEMSSPSTTTVRQVLRELERSRTPRAVDELVRATSRRPSQRWEIASTLAFLESTGLVERRYSPRRLAVQFSKNVDPHGESSASQLARLVGSQRGEVRTDVACKALGLGSTRELDAFVHALQTSGALRRLKSEPIALYSLTATAAFDKGLERRLRVRLIREQARLRALIDFADSKRCRRSHVLTAFGEANVLRECGACDVCLGSLLSPVRSRRTAAQTTESGTKSPLERTSDDASMAGVRPA